MFPRASGAASGTNGFCVSFFCPLESGHGKLNLRAGDPRLLYGRPAQPAQMGFAAQQPQQQTQYNAYSAAAPAQQASAPGYAQPVDPRRAVPSDPRLSSGPGMALQDADMLCDAACMRAWVLRASVLACLGLLHAQPDSLRLRAASISHEGLDCRSVQLRRKVSHVSLVSLQLTHGRTDTHFSHIISSQAECGSWDQVSLSWYQGNHLQVHQAVCTSPRRTARRAAFPAARQVARSWAAWI